MITTVLFDYGGGVTRLSLLRRETPREIDPCPSLAGGLWVTPRWAARACGGPAAVDIVNSLALTSSYRYCGRLTDGSLGRGSPGAELHVAEVPGGVAVLPAVGAAGRGGGAGEHRAVRQQQLRHRGLLAELALLLQPLAGKAPSSY
eukprot:155187-Prorocentrum_minimum.AAC.1